MAKEEWVLEGYALLDDGTRAAFETFREREPSSCWFRLKEIGNEGFTVPDSPGARMGTFIPAHRIREIVYEISQTGGK